MVQFVCSWLFCVVAIDDVKKQSVADGYGNRPIYCDVMTLLVLIEVYTFEVNNNEPFLSLIEELSDGDFAILNIFLLH